MSMLSRWSPFKHPLRVDAPGDFDDLFRGLGLRSMLRDFEPAPEIKLEVSEDDQNYSVRAELAGVDKDDIQVSIERNVVNISAEVKRESERKDGERVVHSERYFGRVSRSFALPFEVDEAAAKASYDKGVLSLLLPKKSGAGARRVSVD